MFQKERVGSGLWRSSLGNKRDEGLKGGPKKSPRFGEDLGNSIVAENVTSVGVETNSKKKKKRNTGGREVLIKKKKKPAGNWGPTKGRTGKNGCPVTKQNPRS